MQISAKTRLLARFLGCSQTILTVGAGLLRVAGRGDEVAMDLASLKDFQVRHRWLWSDVSVTTPYGFTRVHRGFPKAEAERLSVCARLHSLDSAVTQLLEEYAAIRGYLTHSGQASWMKRAAPLASLLPDPLVDSALPVDPVRRLNRLREIVRMGERGRTSRNDIYVRQQREKHADLFHSGLGYPLNGDQTDAILHDEDRALIVAGAGTGKTSTIVGKTLHLLREGLATESEIIMVAYTKKAAEEMEERLASHSVKGIAIKTFHALGNEGIAQATGRKPSISKLAEDNWALPGAIREYVSEILSDPSRQGRLTEYLAQFRYAYRAPETFATEHDYFQYIQGQNVRTLRGEQVKSVEECMIADWLTTHGIRYEYERHYEHETASIQFRQYQPDFYLPEYGIYLEHFGINRQGRPAPFIDDPQVYLDGMAWKRDLHRKHKTKLIETFSYFAAEGRLADELDRLLRAEGVRITAISVDDFLPLLTQQDILDPFLRMVASFLNLFKSNGWTESEVRQRALDAKNIRGAKFLDVFSAILAKYEAALRREVAIDFSDMINETVGHVQSGRFSPGYRYILVDEFQDISRGRARLIQALLAQNPGAKLFAVGDDWQSIYRFAGSDIDLMTRFAVHFGHTRRTDLRTTHRFNDRLLQASSRFVSANPQQLRKELVAPRKRVQPAIAIVSGSSVGTGKEGALETASGMEGAAKDPLVSALQAIAFEDPADKIDVLVMGRYNHLLEPCRQVPVPDCRLKLRFLSVHAAKGLEADYAIVLDVIGGKLGFPNAIVDDPLLELVLAGVGTFPHAEERRLFYVALTRARHKTFILTRNHQRSVFVDELEGEAYRDLVIPSKARQESHACPKCKGGRLIPRTGSWGTFFGCSNYPLCESITELCSECESGAFIRGQESFRCTNEQCGKSQPVCPSCRVGALVPREGRYGKFLGCTKWRPKGVSCTFKRNLRDSSQP